MRGICSCATHSYGRRRSKAVLRPGDTAMANPTKKLFLDELGRRLGSLRKLGSGQSLYANQDDSVRVYIRYSKLHERGRTFYGLRQEDLREFAGPTLFCVLPVDTRKTHLSFPSPTMRTRCAQPPGV